MSQVYLLDGSSFFYRAFYAIRELRRSDGMATNAVYGYILSLKSLLNEYRPEEIAVAFDRPEPTFRHKQYKEYKANRSAAPDDLIAQIPWIKKVTERLGIPQFERPGFEADDLLGAMAVFLAQRGRESVIVTGDKDLLQLVNGSVSVLRQGIKQNVLYREPQVRERRQFRQRSRRAGHRRKNRYRLDSGIRLAGSALREHPQSLREKTQRKLDGIPGSGISLTGTGDD